MFTEEERFGAVDRADPAFMLSSLSVNNMDTSSGACTMSFEPNTRIGGAGGDAAHSSVVDIYHVDSIVRISGFALASRTFFFLNAVEPGLAVRRPERIASYEEACSFDEVAHRPGHLPEVFEFRISQRRFQPCAEAEEWPAT